MALPGRAHGDACLDRPPRSSSTREELVAPHRCFIGMPHFVLILFLLITVTPVLARTSGEPTPRGEYSRTMDKANVDFLRELADRIKKSGYEQVEIVPQMFVVIAKKPEGKPQMLIVDYNTMRAIEVENGLDVGVGLKSSTPETKIPELH